MRNYLMVFIFAYICVWQPVSSQETTERSSRKNDAQKIIQENYASSASVFYGSRYDMQDHENSTVPLATINIKRMKEIPTQQISYAVTPNPIFETNPGFWYGAYTEYQEELAKSMAQKKNNH